METVVNTSVTTTTAAETAHPGRCTRTGRDPSLETIKMLSRRARLTNSPLQGHQCAVGGRGAGGLCVGHPAVTVEEYALRDHHDGGFDVTEDARALLELDPIAGDDVPHQLAADDQRAGANVSVDDPLLADDERVGGGDLAVELAVQHHGATERVLALDLRAFVDERAQVVARRHRLPGLSPHRRPYRARLRLRADPLVLDEVDGQLRLAPARLHDVAAEGPALGDDERVCLDVAVHPPGGGDLDGTGRDHRALVHSSDDGVDGLYVRVHHALLADHELPPDVQFAADLALDMDGIGDLEFTLHLRGGADDREQGQRGGGAALLRRGRPARYRRSRSSRTTEHPRLLKTHVR